MRLVISLRFHLTTEFKHKSTPRNPFKNSEYDLHISANPTSKSKMKMNVCGDSHDCMM